MRWLIGLLLLAVAAPATAKPGVQVTIARGESGAWTVDYAFAHRAAVWFFPRSNPDLAGKPWRPQSWTVETPGVRLERVGRYDALVGDAPLRRVRIRMLPFAEPLSADYTPALAFSDGGLAFYTNQFVPLPVGSRAALAALPLDLNGVALADPQVVLRFSDPGRRLLIGGKAHKGAARLVADDGGAYVYSGDAPLIETVAFAGVLDPGLPAWVRGELDGFTPRLMKLYAERLGPPAGARPMALVAWQGAERPGFSMGGSVLEAMVVMQVSGRQVLEPQPMVLERMRWFIGHESAHFWMGQTVRYAARDEGWIVEGGADLLAIRALEHLVPGYDARGTLQAGLDECLALTGPGEPLARAEERGEHRAYYGCGAMLLLAAESAARRADPKADVFTWLRALIDANRGDGVVSAGDWFARFEAVAGVEAAREARRFVREGAAVPQAFWVKLFALTGVGVVPERERLLLVPNPPPEGEGDQA